MRVNRKFFFSIVLLAALALVVVLGPGVLILYQRQTHQPQIETLYQAANQDVPERIVYEMPDTLRRDYHHLYLSMESREPGTMGCSVEYVLADGEKVSSSFRETSSFYRFAIPSDHIKTVRRIELSELENVSRIELWNTFIEP
jgi:hypothetical protein